MNRTNSKLQRKGKLSIFLACLMIIMTVASGSITSSSFAAETTEINTDTFASMTIDTDSLKMDVDDESGSFASQYHLSKAKANQVLKSEESLENYLNKENDDHIYEVEQSSDDDSVYTVTAPYQEQELIIPSAYADEVMDQIEEKEDWVDYSDAETTSYSDDVVLSFDSEEETKEALETIQAKYGDNACYSNELLKVDFMDDTDVNSDSDNNESGSSSSDSSDLTGSGSDSDLTGSGSSSDSTGSGSISTESSESTTGSTETIETTEATIASTETSETTEATTASTETSETTEATTASTTESETTITPTVTYTCKSWGATYMGMESLKNQSLPSGANHTVLVAVIDTGVDKTSSLFSGRISSLSYNFLTNSKNVTDTYGHGTHVAGIIADSTPSNVKILSLKIMNKNGYTTLKAVLNALSYAITKNVAVINMSIALDGSNKSAVKALNKLINRAYAKGIPICAAAGNDSINVKYCYPASYSTTIAVSSITKSGKLSDFSNYGSGIDFCAPGTAITSAYLKGKTKTLDGTSMASPHIAAAIAYIKMMQSNLSVSGVISELKSYCVDLGSKGKDSKYGYGYPKITKLYTKGITHKTSTAATTISSISNTSSGISLKWSKVAGISSYAIYRTSGTKYTKIATTSKTSYTDKKAKNGTSYSYYISVVKSGQIGKASSKKKITRLTKISTITLSKCSATSMRVRWNKLSKISGIQIQLSNTKTFKNPISFIAKSSVRRTVIKSITSGLWYVRARTYKGSTSSRSYSAWSTIKSINLAK